MQNISTYKIFCVSLGTIQKEKDKSAKTQHSCKLAWYTGCHHGTPLLVTLWKASARDSWWVTFSQWNAW